jgi:two-component system, OmpR family, sensor histidine kinase KdpD
MPQPREIQVPPSKSDGESSTLPAHRRQWIPPTYIAYLATLGVVGICSLLGWGTSALGLTSANVVMIFLAGVATAAACFGRGPSIAAAIASVVVFDFFFVHPRFSLLASDAQYFVVLAVMLGIGLLISELTARLQTQLRQARERERKTVELARERDQSLIEAHEAQMLVQSEQTRNSLLSAVSHDLRSPLAMIAVTASSLLEDTGDENRSAKREMLQTIVDESHWLSRQVDNLLDMARLDSGAVSLNCDWHVLEEMVGVSIARLRPELKGYDVRVSLPVDFPLLWVADSLFEQMLVNLLENAIRYTPLGSRIEIAARRCGNQAEITIADNGTGLPPGSEAKVFDKFFRGASVVDDGQRGIGLGLTICRGIARAHGGDIRAANRPEGGAEFTITIPCPMQSPQVNLDETSAPVNA